MGRCYAFECSKCHFKTRVSGGRDRGLHCFTLTLVCLDCRDVFDAVTHVRLKGPIPLAYQKKFGGLRRLAQPAVPLPDHASFSGQVLQPAVKLWEDILRSGRASKWIEYRVRCAQSPIHRTRPWTHPGKCPRCGSYLDRTLLPFRIWE